MNKAMFPTLLSVVAALAVTNEEVLEEIKVVRRELAAGREL